MDDMESGAVFVDGDVDMNVTATPDNSSVNLMITVAKELEQYGGFVSGDVDVFEGELTEPTEWTAKGLCHV